MRIAIAGGTGFLGRHLISELQERGYEPVLIARQAHSHGIPAVSWDRLNEEPNCLKGVKAIVNLAGETINQRWTTAAKQRILQSRLETTAALAQWVDQVEEKPSVILQGSAIGRYGSSHMETYTERSDATGEGFLADVVKQWERAADQMMGIRLVKLRTGVVLGKAGGAFGKMLLPYRIGVGGPIAKGNQWMSWIHVRDWTALAVYLLEQEQLEGPVNMTAPEPVRNDAFGRTLARVMRRPHWFPVPAPMLRLIFGEMAELLTEGQRVLPERALQAGFAFRYPDLESAIQELIG